MRWLVLVIALTSNVAQADTNDVYFSPHGGARQAIVRELATVQKGETVLVQAYGFTSVTIAEALVQAVARGAHVALLVDRVNLHDRRSQAAYSAAHGVAVLVDKRHPIAHAKVVIIVGREVIAGSYNFTEQSERNSEDLLVLHDASLAARFTDNWHRHEAHCEPLAQAAAEAPRAAAGRSRRW
jgi:phosphatidylserine/phosphatidylglycerophosphate/cardiolipin synthase-like enzyme